MRLNHAVQMNTKFIRSKPVLHMVDVATHFSAATFLRSQSAAEIWNAVLANWVYVYAGPLDVMHVDQGSSYISNEMRGNLGGSGVKIIEAPIETPGAIGTVEGTMFLFPIPLKRSGKRARGGRRNPNV